MRAKGLTCGALLLCALAGQARAQGVEDAYRG